MKKEETMINEISEEMAQFIAESLNGGEFEDGKWYTDGQRDAWLMAVRPWAEEIVYLHERIGKLDNKIMVGDRSVKDDD